MVAQLALGAGVLHQRREAVDVGELRRGLDANLDTERLGARAHHVDRLRQDVIGDREEPRSALRRAQAERHGLGRCRRLVQHRSVRDGHPGEVRHHRLEIDERLEAALRDLRLVRRVRGVPGGVLEDVAQDHARRVGLVVALPDERLHHHVLLGDAAQARERLAFGARRADAHGVAAADGGRNDGIDELGARAEAQHAQHGGLVGRVGPDVAALECAVVLEIFERGAGGNRRVGHGGS